jgi:heat shock protein HslJ
MSGTHFQSVCSMLAVSALALSAAPGSALGSTPFTAVPLFLSGQTSNWVVRSLHNSAPIHGTTITARFEEGQMSGSAGCNRYWATYRAEGGEFRISSPISTTRMACLRSGVMEQEASYLAALEAARTYTISERRLLLRNADGEVLVRFQKTRVMEP